MSLNFDKSRNPMLKERSFAKVDTLESRTGGPYIDGSLQMTVNGAVNKTLVLVLITLMSFFIGFKMPSQIMLYGGLFGGMICYFVASAKPHLSPILAPIYAALEGLFVGVISLYYSSLFDGVIFQAVSLTIGTLLTMLLVYKSGLIKVTKSFRSGVTMAVGSIMIVYIIQLLGNFIGFSIPYLFDGGLISIGICIVIIAVASLNLLLDFDNFEKGEAMGAPKYMEWYFGMSLLFTLVWLYVEFMRLLSYLQSD